MKENNEKKSNIFLFFLLMVGIFIVFDFVATQLIGLFGRSILYGKYMKEIVAEIIYLIIILLVVLIFKNQYIFNEKKKVGFVKGLLLAVPMLFYVCLNFSIKEILSAKLYDVLSLGVYTLLIGLAEEFMCRGWIQNEMIERFGKNRKQVILSIILSGLIFGVMHFSNIFAGQGIIETISQIIQAVGSGFMLGAIYYRSKNIWLVVFLHAFWDFVIMTGDLSLMKECTFLNPNIKASLFSLIASIPIASVFFASGLFLLRNSKICTEFGLTMTKEEQEKENKNVWKLVFVVAIGPFTKDFEKAKVCYEYTDMELSNYSLMRTYKDKYIIEYEKWEEINEDEDYVDNFEFSFEVIDNKLVITNEMINQNISLDYEVLDYTVIESDDLYLIAVLTHENEGSILYYSNYIINDEMLNEEDYLVKIKESFKRYVLPDSSNILTLLKENSDDPLIAVANQNGFTYIETDDELYMVYQ